MQWSRTVAMQQAWLKIGTSHMTLTFDLLIWKWYMKHCSFMGCISATYEAHLSNCRQAKEWTRPIIWMTCVTLTFYQFTWKLYIVTSWVVFVPHMNTIHELGNKPQSRHGTRNGQTGVRMNTQSETNIPTPLVCVMKNVNFYMMIQCIC